MIPRLTCLANMPGLDALAGLNLYPVSKQ